MNKRNDNYFHDQSPLQTKKKENVCLFVLELIWVRKFFFENDSKQENNSFVPLLCVNWWKKGKTQFLILSQTSSWKILNNYRQEIDKHIYTKYNTINTSDISLHAWMSSQFDPLFIYSFSELYTGAASCPSLYPLSQLL